MRRRCGGWGLGRVGLVRPSANGRARLCDKGAAPAKQAPSPTPGNPDAQDPAHCGWSHHHGGDRRGRPESAIRRVDAGVGGGPGGHPPLLLDHPVHLPPAGRVPPVQRSASAHLHRCRLCELWKARLPHARLVRRVGVVGFWPRRWEWWEEWEPTRCLPVFDPSISHSPFFHSSFLSGCSTPT